MEDMARMAWRISPILAIFLPDRLRNAEVIVREVTRLLRNNPEVRMYLIIAYNAYGYIVRSEGSSNDFRKDRSIER